GAVVVPAVLAEPAPAGPRRAAVGAGGGRGRRRRGSGGGHRHRHGRRAADLRPALVAEVVRAGRVPLRAGVGAHCARPTRTVLVDRVSRAISSAASTLRRSRTVPVAASSMSTTVASSSSVALLPLACASCAARPNLIV